MSYAAFLEGKQRAHGQIGAEIAPGDLHPMLHEWQAQATAWAIRKGRCAIFWDCGLGKTFAQIEWATHSAERSLILAPLSVARQTVREAGKLNRDVRYVRHGDEVDGPGVWITNYELADRFDWSVFGAVVADESSILKNVDGKTRRMLTERARQVPLRLACTATPAPNDVAELTNHAEWLGVMSRAEMLAAYFVNDEKEWRLKGHAADPMFRWMTSWAHTLRSPSDMGYPDDDYRLPPLSIIAQVVDCELEAPDGQLFAADLGGVGGRMAVRRQTIGVRVERVVELVNESARVQSEMERRESREGARISTQDSRASERETTPAICGVSRTSRSGESRGERLSQGEPTASAGLVLRADGFGAGAPSGEWLHGVRLNGKTAHRSLPQNGHNSRAPLPALQSSPGALGRRSSADTGPAFVPDPYAWVIWCGLNEEQNLLADAFGDQAISIYGTLSPEEKEERLCAWLDAERPILLSKPSICGFGLNLQRAHKMAFVGLSDSYESYYQAIRREWRYGQSEPVQAHIVVSGLESQIVENVRRKERQAARATASLIRHMHEQERHR